MRFWVKALIALVAGWGAWSLYHWRVEAGKRKAWAELLGLEGLDLRGADAERLSRAGALFTRYAPLDPEGPGGGSKPWAVARLPRAGGEDRVVLLRSFQASGEPGEAPRPAAHATVLGPAGDVLGVSSFVCGDAAAPREVLKLDRPEARGGCLQITSPLGEQSAIRLIYGLLEGRLVLIRAENEDGEALARPLFAFGAEGVGPKPANEPYYEWRSRLSSPDPARVLESLSWLGTRFEAAEDEPSPYAFLDKIRLNAEVRNSLLHLVKSPNEWIRSAAELASRP
jgi:hypothetical protein